MNKGIILTVLLITVMVVTTTINNKSKKLVMNEKLELVLQYFEKTKDMSWIEACSVLNNEIKDDKERVNIKMRVKALREIKDIDYRQD